ncbi:hypothetical protein RHMOL_Rhmol06G0251800 [Rhododendron molle]|uniref:Uncharacterized protein n=1 Tax=Rhododendron molle TaxID=49168 RepID=A0ACC0NFX7_RHOML|nr:hypothetical protein RHMOL_Rhmol06G0251800 [Rhododendron molle]
MGYSSYQNPYGYGPGHGYEVSNQNPYAYGVGYGYGTRNPNPYAYGSVHGYETRNPYSDGPGRGYRGYCLSDILRAVSLRILPKVRSVSNLLPPIPPKIEDCMGSVVVVVVVVVRMALLMPKINRIVIKVALKGKKSSSKIWEIVGKVPGVESVAFAGQDKNHVVVIGDGIDSVELTVLLRKKVGSAELVRVGPVEYGGDGRMQIPVWGYSSYQNQNEYGPGHGYEVSNQNPYAYGVRYGYETRNPDPYAYGLVQGQGYQTRNPYADGPDHGIRFPLEANHDLSGEPWRWVAVLVSPEVWIA